MATSSPAERVGGPAWLLGVERWSGGRWTMVAMGRAVPPLVAPFAGGALATRRRARRKR